ncbi:MAG: T9SS type A sorting domain-containing protein [Elusimicrobia bacterium]|nr:T9SS type A sorting domain-containing protein [Elusimicrobiota bacterium]
MILILKKTLMVKLVLMLAVNLMLLPFNAHANEGLLINSIGNINGNNFSRFVVQGDYAYVAAGIRGVKIINISNPYSPENVGLYNNECYYLYVQGEFAYVCTGKNLHIVNITDPSDPIFISQYPASGTCYGVSVSNDIAYISDSDFGLIVLDVSNPYNPKKIGQQILPSMFPGISVSGDYAYLCGGPGAEHLYIIDISNPRAPVHVQTFNANAYIYSWHTSNDHAYLVCWDTPVNSRCEIIDISNPSFPHLIAEYVSTGTPSSAFVQNDYLYLCDGTNDLQVINISIPSHPKFIGRYDFSSSFRHVFVSGEHVYMTHDQGLNVFFHIISTELIPAILLNTESFSFIVSEKTNPPDQKLIITNSGDRDSILNWEAKSNKEWLRVSPEKGSIMQSQSKEVDISVDINGLMPGQYDGTITVTDPNASNICQVIDVSLTLDYGLPIIQLKSQIISVIAQKGIDLKDTISLRISNSGAIGTILEWSATHNAEWISVPENSGLIPRNGEPLVWQDVNLVINPSNLSLGAYSEILTVINKKVPTDIQEITVDLTVLPDTVIFFNAINQKFVTNTTQLSGTYNKDIPGIEKINVTVDDKTDGITNVLFQNGNWHADWDTRSYSDGTHHIEVAIHAAGNTILRSIQHINVDNKNPADLLNLSNKEYLATNINQVIIRGGSKGYINPLCGEVAQIHFMASVPGIVKVYIYNLNGQLIWETTKVIDQQQDYIEWTCQNTAHETVASGVYIAYVEGPGLKKTAKIAIIK